LACAPLLYRGQAAQQTWVNELHNRPHRLAAAAAYPVFAAGPAPPPSDQRRLATSQRVISEPQGTAAHIPRPAFALPCRRKTYTSPTPIKEVGGKVSELIRCLREEIPRKNWKEGGWGGIFGGVGEGGSCRLRRVTHRILLVREFDDGCWCLQQEGVRTRWYLPVAAPLPSRSRHPNRPALAGRGRRKRVTSVRCWAA